MSNCLKQLLFLFNIFLLLTPCYCICDSNVIFQEISDCFGGDWTEETSSSLTPQECSCLKNLELKLPHCQITLQKLNFDYQKCLRRLQNDREGTHPPPDGHEETRPPREGTRPPPDGHEGTRPPREGTRPPPDGHEGTHPPRDDHEGTHPPRDGTPDGTPPPSREDNKHDDNDEAQSENTKDNDSQKDSHHGSHFSSSDIALISTGCGILAAIVFGVVLNVLRYRYHTPSPARALVTPIPMVELHDTIVIVDNHDLVMPSYVAVALPVNHHSLDEENRAY